MSTVPERESARRETAKARTMPAHAEMSIGIGNDWNPIMRIIVLLADSIAAAADANGAGGVCRRPTREESDSPWRRA